MFLLSNISNLIGNSAHFKLQLLHFTFIDFCYHLTFLLISKGISTYFCLIYKVAGLEL